MAIETYSIQPTDTLGSIPDSLACAGLKDCEVDTWLTDHEDAGEFTILRDSDGQPECGYVFGLCGGACACECGRPECPDHA